MSLQSDITEKQVLCFKLIRDKNFILLADELEVYAGLIDSLISNASDVSKDELKVILDRHNELLEASDSSKLEVGDKLSSLYKTAKAVKGYKGKSDESVSITGTKKG